MREKFILGLRFLLSFGMSFLVLLALWQVFTRYVLGDPSIFTEELLRYVMIWSAMFGIVLAFCTKEHLAMSLFTKHLNDLKSVNLMIHFFPLIFALFVMVIGGCELSLNNRHQLSPILGLSMGVVYSVIPLSGLMIVLIKILDIKEQIKTWGKGESPWN